MATFASTPLQVDPAKGAKYPVVISERLLSNESRSQWNFASVQLNHKPKLSNPYPASSITTAGSDEDSCNLHLTSDNQQSNYLYTGSQQPSTTCALIFNSSTNSFTLDKINTDFTFNLRSTPTNKRAKDLANQYPQLETTAPDPTSSSEDDLFSNVEDSVPDPDNPYDYRHFLKRRRISSPEPITIEAPSIPPPVKRPFKPKPKQRLTHKPPPPRPSPPPREETDADNEDSDDGGLTIEMEPDIKPRHRFNAFAHLDRTGSGPISLRSAASSVSPAGRQSPDHSGDEVGEEVEEEESEESDEDVLNETHWPSPLAKAPTPVEMHVEGEDEEEEEEDEDEDGGDLEAELQRELEKVNGEEESRRYIQESSSESEEE